MITGEINKLKVLRKTDIGYLLIDENNTEVFMHFNESERELSEEEEIDVYLFFDKKHRLTASMHMPYLTISNCGFLSVKDINPKLGIFLDNNCSKDLLLSAEYLPISFRHWPQVGDKLLVKLVLKETNITARLCGKQEIIDSFRVTKPYNQGDNVEGFVCKLTSSGLGIATTDKQYVFVHNKLLRGEYRLGQFVTCTITQVREEDFNGTLLQHKERMIDPDKTMILEYINHNGGDMSYDAKSSAEEIEQVFKMSRKAFKRALGSLYKEQVVYFDETGTHLKK